jgi:primosomal protein N' (replication factor Y) (superfamily II helicase)
MNHLASTRAEPQPLIVEVLLPLALDQPYSYKVPAELNLKQGDVVAIPFGTRDAIGVVWNINTSTIKHESKLKSIKEKLDWPAFTLAMYQFIEWIARYTLAPRGLVMKMALRDPESVAPERPKISVRLTGLQPKRPTAQRLRLMDIVKTAGELPKADIARLAEVSTSVMNALIDEGVLETYVMASLTGAALDPDFAQFDLSPDQQEAAQILAQKVRETQASVTLLEGITGSGKTEVYFEAIAAALKLGKQVLILMPEIALTSQFLERFTKRFGARPCEWHSGISEAKRTRHYHAIASGVIQVAAGARSALFLPFNNLGLIIVDEEHEAAYKQGDGVHYHARDMAVVRGKFENCAVILASATPSIETRVNAEHGRYTHVRLHSRFGGRVLPDLSAIDMRKDAPKTGEWITPLLQMAILETVQRGEQAILFLNRRGFAPLTLCRACGHRWQCPHCTAWLVEHRFRASLVCHHCGHIERTPRDCVACGETNSLSPVGPGVERLGEEVANKFKDHRSVVLSSDFSGGSERLREELEKVAKGEFDIIIGTQLIAKGHNFPGVTLAAVIDADIGLANGDPRASERTFQLLQQVTGRAGRGAIKGRGILQTYQPEHPVLKAILSGDSERFYAQEIELRRQMSLPPFGRLAGIIVSAATRVEAENHAKLIARAALELSKQSIYADISTLGPADAPIAIIRGRHRFRLLLKAPRKADIQAFMREVLTKIGTARGSVRVLVDVDPMSFM